MPDINDAVERQQGHGDHHDGLGARRDDHVRRHHDLLAETIEALFSLAEQQTTLIRELYTLLDEALAVLKAVGPA